MARRPRNEFPHFSTRYHVYTVSNEAVKVTCNSVLSGTRDAVDNSLSHSQFRRLCSLRMPLKPSSLPEAGASVLGLSPFSSPQ